MSEKSPRGKRATAQSTTVVDLAAAREQQKFVRKEQKLDALRERFSQALAVDEHKPGAKLKKVFRRKKKKQPV